MTRIEIKKTQNREEKTRLSSLDSQLNKIIKDKDNFRPMYS